jgi:hypothetical protein
MPAHAGIMAGCKEFENLSAGGNIVPASVEPLTV